MADRYVLVECAACAERTWTQRPFGRVFCDLTRQYEERRVVPEEVRLIDGSEGEDA